MLGVLPVASGSAWQLLDSYYGAAQVRGGGGGAGGGSSAHVRVRASRVGPMAMKP